ncbi:MAG: hypothetical protein M9962_10730 [Oligoflexia bacterium]|nr:hypothetical protein [Oligoflexia bacterium]
MVIIHLVFLTFFSLASRDVDLPRPLKCFKDRVSACINEHQAKLNNTQNLITIATIEIQSKVEEIKIIQENKSRLSLDLKNFEEQRLLTELEIKFIHSNKILAKPNLKILDEIYDISSWFNFSNEDADWSESAPSFRLNDLMNEFESLNSSIKKTNLQLSHVDQRQLSEQKLLQQLEYSIQTLKLDHNHLSQQVNRGCKEQFCPLEP